ncbi:lytic transglycosylase domain-containing protein [Paraherbaspirillum soli]|uniref:Lytic transglycosylase domain-containing protein n=1 Tax=Paraherbaspirillum soli TaxID=631222 RepID=A0ABW0MF28_9BURK
MQILPFLLMLCCAPVLMTPVTLFAQVYGGTSAGGTIVLSNFKSPETRELVVAPLAAAPTSIIPSKVAASPIPIAFKELLNEAAIQYKLDPNLLHAVIKVESGYNPTAISPKGARGLMQLMPDTARRFGAKNSLNPRENVQAGAQYLSWLLDLFKGDIELALAGYNAGEQAVIRAGNRVPAYTETRNYVVKVLAQYQRNSKKDD